MLAQIENTCIWITILVLLLPVVCYRMFVKFIRTALMKTGLRKLIDLSSWSESKTVAGTSSLVSQEGHDR